LNRLKIAPPSAQVPVPDVEESWTLLPVNVLSLIAPVVKGPKKSAPPWAPPPQLDPAGFVWLTLLPLKVVPATVTEPSTCIGRPSEPVKTDEGTDEVTVTLVWLLLTKLSSSSSEPSSS